MKTKQTTYDVITSMIHEAHAFRSFTPVVLAIRIISIHMKIVWNSAKIVSETT